MLLWCWLPTWGNEHSRHVTEIGSNLCNSVLLHVRRQDLKRCYRNWFNVTLILCAPIGMINFQGILQELVQCYFNFDCWIQLMLQEFIQICAIICRCMLHKLVQLCAILCCAACCNQHSRHALFLIAEYSATNIQGMSQELDQVNSVF